MNVAVVSDWFGLAGGLGVYSRIIAETYRKLGLTVVKSSIISNDLGCYQIKTTQNVIGRFHDSLMLKYLRIFKEKFKIDFIHANILNASHALAFAKAARQIGLPYILTAHTYVFLCPIEMYCRLPELVPCGNPFPNPRCFKCVISKSKGENYEKPISAIAHMLYNMTALRYLMNNSEYIISPSKDFAALIDKSLNVGQKVRYLLNPIDPIFLDNAPIFQGDGSACFWGRLEFAKGAHLLADLAKAIAPAPLHVIGYGTFSNVLQQNKPSNLVYHGYLGKSELIKKARESSLVIVPSIGYEMSSYTTMEAFALGKPVIAFDIGGPKEQIEASGGGLLAKPFSIQDFCEKLMHLLANPSEASIMGKHARGYAENFLDPIKYSMPLKEMVNNLPRINI
ncbi:glycosyltransferase family 4 protein [Candidatus Bathyarchaeota archaeon A05DMB-2]|nr:glycosyltransferase family 4 protein [Candidatus Bathyarchaeota archaeon A05DMB-2]